MKHVSRVTNKPANSGLSTDDEEEAPISPRSSHTTERSINSDESLQQDRDVEMVDADSPVESQSNGWQTRQSSPPTTGSVQGEHLCSRLRNLLT